MPMAAVRPLRRLPRLQPYVCARCVHRERRLFIPGPSAVDEGLDETAWKDQAERIRAGLQPSMLTLLEQRGLVKDVAGGREALDWLLTEKRIGAYVGVDPTAPSLHVGHLLPLMALFWMYLSGFYTVSLLGAGTVQIGDPSGRTSARARTANSLHRLNTICIKEQLTKLWVHVKALGIKAQFPTQRDRRRRILNNNAWLSQLSAVDMIKGIGSAMRLGTMLSRDSVKTRLETGDGMSLSEFCYPMFQGYDWWHMYREDGVQLQVGGSDQYGNICAGMDAVDHMRSLHSEDGKIIDSKAPINATFGLTTPLLTTASGQKFGKSEGNAVWLDKDMLSSFDLYQYFLRTSDDDVERYLKLFTFLPLEFIALVMQHQKEDASRRIAQHLLARYIVELAHGAEAAKEAEAAHKEAFTHGTNAYSLRALRRALDSVKQQKAAEKMKAKADELSLHKAKYLTTPNKTAETGSSSVDRTASVVTIPTSLLRKGTFPQVLHALGLVSSKTEARRMIESHGAYVVVPNSGLPADPNGLRWEQIPKDADPNHYLVDYEALVLRSGKSKIQVCRVLRDDRFESEGFSCPGWEDIKAKRDEADSVPKTAAAA